MVDLWDSWLDCRICICTRGRGVPLAPFDPEIEATIRRSNARRRRREQTMERGEPLVARDDVLEHLQPQLQELMREREERNRQRPIQQMFTPDNLYEGDFGRGINANSFELKSGLINMVQQYQYGGGAPEDPNAHIMTFVEICGPKDEWSTRGGHKNEIILIFAEGQG